MNYKVGDKIRRIYPYPYARDAGGSCVTVGSIYTIALIHSIGTTCELVEKGGFIYELKNFVLAEGHFYERRLQL